MNETKSKREELRDAGYIVLTPSQVGGFYCPLREKLERESGGSRTNLKAYVGNVTHRIIERILLGEDVNVESEARADLIALESGEAIDRRNGKKIDAIKVET